MSLIGTFSPPGDKSISHRIALVSLLAGGETTATNLGPGGDVQSSLNTVRLLGVDVRTHEGAVVLTGAQGRIKENAHIDCGNSGTTMRLLMGILAGCPGEFVLDGDESLRKRPMERVAAPLRSMGAQVETNGGRSPVTIHGGRLRGIAYTLPVASAQLKSAVLLAGMLADGTTTVTEQVPSRDHTERLIALMGGHVEEEKGRISVTLSTLTLPESFAVPGDISSAAFFICAACITPGSDVTAERVLLNPTRTGFLTVLQRMGAQIGIHPMGDHPEPWGMVRARFSPDLTGCEIRAEEIPSLVDEVPILALVATQADGVTVFKGAGELRVKESDRLAAVAAQLGAMQAQVRVDGDMLVIDSRTRLTAPSSLVSYGDHRIAMTLRLAAVLADADPVIEGESSAGISYPGFHETLRSLLP